MTNYGNGEEIARSVGLTLSTKSIPNEELMNELMDDATKMINAEVHASSNITDTYGELAVIEKSLVQKKVRNLWSFLQPDDFPYEEVVLSADQKRIVHRLHDASKGTQWELGT